MRLLWGITPLGWHGISLLGLVARTMDTYQSMLEQTRHSILPGSFSNLLLGHPYDSHCSLHEIHRCFVSSGKRLSTQQQAHLYNLFRMDDRLRQSGFRVADSDQLLLSLHLSDELTEDQLIVTITHHGHLKRASAQCN